MVLLELDQLVNFYSYLTGDKLLEFLGGSPQTRHS